jgi:hypothetical protein
MFSNQHRKAKLLFGLSDILLVAFALEAAYLSRLSLPNLRHNFFFTPDKKALVLGIAVFAWVLAGYWRGVYENLGTGQRRVIFRDLLHQAGYASVALILAEYLLRLDLSRPFLFFFTSFAFTLILVFRLASRRLVGLIRREFGALSTSWSSASVTAPANSRKTSKPPPTRASASKASSPSTTSPTPPST